MSEVEENNRTLARSFVEAQANADLDALDEMLASDFVSHKNSPAKNPIARATSGRSLLIRPPSPRAT